MSSFSKALSPCHGSQGVWQSPSFYNFARGVNKKGPTPFQCSRFGTQQRMPLSPVRPMQGGVQNSALSALYRWSKEKKAEEANENQEAKGFGSATTNAQSPSVRHESNADDAEMRFVSVFFDDVDAMLYDHMPPACDLAWTESQQAWMDLAINHPISLNSGKCSVHLLGIGHDHPTNASALKALVDAVQPDTIAIEQSPQFSKRFRAVARELAPQLDKLMALGLPAGIREAHLALSAQERRLWRQVVFEGDLALKPGSDPEYQLQARNLMVHGRVLAIEFLAAAHLASSNGISLEGIDLEEGSEAEMLVQSPAFQEEYSRQLQPIVESEAFSSMSFCTDIDRVFAEWHDNVKEMKSSIPLNGSSSFTPAYGPFVQLLADMSVSPDTVERIYRFEEEVRSGLTGKAAAYGHALHNARNLEMMDRLQQLAEGRWSAEGPRRPRKCIVAVVGRGHVAPMRELAERNTM